MIPLSALRDLFTALPNSYITEPTHINKETGNQEPNIISWIKDRQGETIGSIDWQKSEITIFEEYEYSDEVMQSIGEQKFSDTQRHVDPETPIETENPITFEDGAPTLTDYGKLLYDRQHLSKDDTI